MNWPLCPPDVLAARREQGLSWRELHRSRSSDLPHWRHFLAKMDEAESMLESKALCNDAATAADGACDRFAALMLATFCSKQGAGAAAHGHPAFDGFLCRSERHLLLEQSADNLAAIEAWAMDCNSVLEEFYEISGGNARALLRPRLLRALKCASTLQLIKEQIAMRRDAKGKATAAAAAAAIPASHQSKRLRRCAFVNPKSCVRIEIKASKKGARANQFFL